MMARGLVLLALAAPVPHPAAAFDLVTLRYSCERRVEVPTVYVNDEAQGSVVSLVVEGRLIALVSEPAASGARYGWPSGGSGYVWWTKGDAATLFWKDGASGKETPLLAGCVAQK